MANNKKITYGQFVILGYMENIDGVPKVKINEKLVLEMQPKGNGIKYNKKTITVIQDDNSSHLSRSKESDYSVCMSNRRGPNTTSEQEQTITLIEYILDTDTDMFQIGRLTDSTNSFVVPGFWEKNSPVMSRYAFRIIVNRKAPNNVYIFAAGFDEKKVIFFGPMASYRNSRTDVLTTGGVRIYKPEDQRWYEVSAIFGHLYDVDRSNRKLISDSLNCNLLTPGTIIHTGGIVFQWQPYERMQSISEWDRGTFASEMNKTHVQCPVGLVTLDFRCVGSSSNSSTPAAVIERKPYVFTACGHVHGYDSGLLSGIPLGSTCTLCRQKGPYVAIKAVNDPAVSLKAPTHVFNPCGHVICEEEGTFWAQLKLPWIGQSGKANNPACPFCGIQLDVNNPMTKLVYQNVSNGLDSSLE